MARFHASRRSRMRMASGTVPIPVTMAEVWNDYAMVKWKGFSVPFPAMIHTFVDLCELPKGEWSRLLPMGKAKLKPDCMP